MNEKKHSGSLFLLEIIINILLFSLLLVLCLQFIMKAHTLTRSTNELHKAVTACSNIADIYEAGDGSIQALANYFSSATVSKKQVTIYYDASFVPTSADDAIYIITVTDALQENTFHSAQIICWKDNSTIYSLEACHLDKQTAGLAKEVQDE